MNKNLQNGFILGAALQGKTEATNPFPVTVTFMNGDEEWAKVGVDGEGKIAEPTEPYVAGKGFDGWYDNGVKISFPYSPNADKTLTATFTDMPIGAILYAPLSSNKATAETGQTIAITGENVISFGTVEGVPCASKTISQIGKIEINSNTATIPNSISFWYKSDMAVKKQGSSGGYDIFVGEFNSFYQAQDLGFDIWSSSGLSGGSFQTTKDDKWHHYCIVFPNNSSAAVYIDGILAANRPITVTKVHDIYYFFGSNSILSLTDSVSSLRVYNRALTQDEITLLASEFTPTDR